MLKKSLILVALVAGFAVANAPEANAWVVRRVAPVRRAALPPYPVARRVIAGPVYRPYVARRPVYAAPPVYGYGPRVGGGIYIGF